MVDKNLEKVDREHIINEADSAELDKIDDIDIMATAVLNWHTSIVNQMVHAINMPEEPDDTGKQIEIKVRDPNHPEKDEQDFRTLGEDEIPAFKSGIRYALDLVNKLPFKFVPTDADGNIKQEYEADEPLNEQNT